MYPSPRLAGTKRSRPLFLRRIERQLFAGRRSGCRPTFSPWTFVLDRRVQESFAPEDAVVVVRLRQSKSLKGNSPKFTCALTGDRDEVKVKYGFAATARSTRRSPPHVCSGRSASARIACSLFRVECHGCPAHFRGTTARQGQPAGPRGTGEHRAQDGWSRDRDAWGIRAGPGPSSSSWTNDAGGAPPLHRLDALRSARLRLFSILTASPRNSVLLCLAEPEHETRIKPSAQQPFMMLNDVGQTFGHANPFQSQMAPAA